MNGSERKVRLEALGYGLFRNVQDCFKRKWRYKTAPIASGGTTNYFNDLQGVDRYIEGVEKIRAWQAEMPPIPGIDENGVVTAI